MNGWFPDWIEEYFAEHDKRLDEIDERWHELAERSIPKDGPTFYTYRIIGKDEQ